jgi:endonuclease/exonuclease/phosphatase family metal-dependent hydrolase
MRLRLLTYNIHKAIGVDGRFAPERIIDILRHHDADIVLLQEVDRHAPRSGRLDLASYLARNLRYPYRAVSMNVSLKKGWYGNATLTRHPIGRQRNVDLTIGQMKRRGAQHTRIELVTPDGRRPIDVFNVHLSLIAEAREKQVQRLLELPDLAGLPADEPCIIAGDMNDWRGLLRRPLGAAGFLPATERQPHRRRALATFPSFAPVGGLDRVYYRGPLQRLHAATSRLAIARVASDHLPIIVDFEL